MHRLFSPQDELESRIIAKASYEKWKEEAERYNFSRPCVDTHTESAGAFSNQKCYTQEMRGSRRRAIQFRHLLSRYTAELEQGKSGSHKLHVRDVVTGAAHVVPLHNTNGSIRELDFMIDPVLTVVAYDKNIVAVTVQEKTKNIPKLALFCDISSAKDLGHYLVQVNYGNLNAAQINCAISPDGATVALCVVEDHYDEFLTHFHALKFSSEDAPTVSTFCDISCPHSTWYEPTNHMCFLPRSRDVVVLLGDVPVALSSDPSRFLIMYDVTTSTPLRCVELRDHLFPVTLTCSPDGTWISTLSRDVSERDGELETYVTKLFHAETLTQHLEVRGPLSCDAYNSTSNCNKVMLSSSGHLVAIASTSEFDSVVEFDPWGPNLFYRGTSSMEVTVYRLPLVNATLRALCRDVIVRHCTFSNIARLPLPATLQEYVSYKH